MTCLKGRGNAPPLLMYGHMDVIETAGQEWTYPPFDATVADGFIWGRGALDMKSGLTMMVAALMRAKTEGLMPAGDILLALLCDEESGSNYGAKYMVTEHPEQFAGVKYAIGEFGGYTMHMGARKFYPIQIAEKQACWLKATLRGAGGHGAMPNRGGAMAVLAQMLGRLDRCRLPAHITPVTRQMVECIADNLPLPKGLIFRQLLNPSLTRVILRMLGDLSYCLEPLLCNTINATVVRGGEKINVVPNEVTVELDGRLLPGCSPDDMVSELRKVIGNDVEFEVLRHDPETPEPDLGLFDTLSEILQGADPEAIPVPLMLPAFTDGRTFAKLGIQTYGFTPMTLPKGFKFFETIHAADERIPVGAAEFGTDAIYELIKRYR